MLTQQQNLQYGPQGQQYLNPLSQQYLQVNGTPQDQYGGAYNIPTTPPSNSQYHSYNTPPYQDHAYAPPLINTNMDISSQIKTLTHQMYKIFKMEK